MKDLSNAICSDKKENLKRAEIMMKVGTGYLGADAAKLYRNLREEDKCATACILISKKAITNTGVWQPSTLTVTMRCFPLLSAVRTA